MPDAGIASTRQKNFQKVFHEQPPGTVSEIYIHLAVDDPISRPYGEKGSPMPSTLVHHNRPFRAQCRIGAHHAACPLRAREAPQSLIYFTLILKSVYSRTVSLCFLTYMLLHPLLMVLDGDRLYSTQAVTSREKKMTTFLGYLPRCTLLILIICFGASALSGATISPFGYAVEAMIASETDEVLFLPTLGGVALASIAFQSSIDPAGQSFSYSTAPGQVYNGHSLVLSVSASLIAATGEWDWTTSGELGDPQPLTGFGKWMCGQFSNGSAACTDDAQKTGVINTHQMSSVETISVSSDGNTILSLQTYLELVNNLPVRTEDDTDRTTLGALIESFQNGPTPGTSASSFRVDLPEVTTSSAALGRSSST